jgi:hypothetical protein
MPTAMYAMRALHLLPHGSSLRLKQHWVLALNTTRFNTEPGGNQSVSVDRLGMLLSFYMVAVATSIA